MPDHVGVNPDGSLQPLHEFVVRLRLSNGVDTAEASIRVGPSRLDPRVASTVEPMVAAELLGQGWDEIDRPKASDDEQSPTAVVDDSHDDDDREVSTPGADLEAKDDTADGDHADGDTTTDAVPAADDGHGE